MNALLLLIAVTFSPGQRVVIDPDQNVRGWVREVREPEPRPSNYILQGPRQTEILVSWLDKFWRRHQAWFYPSELHRVEP